MTHYETDPGNPLSDQHKEIGYQTYENLLGWVQVDATNKIIMPGERLAVQRPGLYGECSDTHFLSLMDSEATASCGFPRQVMT